MSSLHNIFAHQWPFDASILDLTPRLLPAYVTQAERGEGFAKVARALLDARCGWVLP